jgi:hypothetical protein
MVNTHYNLVHNHFESADASSQRGKTSEAGLMAYAAYLLERIGQTEILPGDVYYRFDIKQIVE